MARLVAARGTVLPVMLMLAGCGIVGPIYDPGLRNAPRLACASIAPADDPQQCIRFERRRLNGERLSGNDGQLDAETEWLAFRVTRPDCATGDLTFATVTGHSSQPGRLSILAFGAAGGQVSAEHAWRESFGGQPRTFRLRGAGGPFVNAIGISIRAPAGGFRVERVCFADYWRRDILPLRASMDQP